MRELVKEIVNVMAELSLVAEGKTAGAFDPSGALGNI